MDRKEYKKQWYQDNKERVDASNRLWAQKNPERTKSIRRNHKTLVLYGITESQYLERLDWQEGKCEICENKLDVGRNCHLDHNHATGKIRGFLCHSCNTGIGKLKDSVELLEKAITYLRKHDGKKD